MTDAHSNLVIHLTTRKILLIILSLQLAFLGLVSIDNIGFEIPILRQAVGFIYLTFIPGFIIIRILKVSSRSAVETLLYSIGLSLSLLMFLGAFINFLYPLVGISKPISEVPLIVTIGMTVLFLCLIYYLSKDHSVSLSVNTEQILSPHVLSLLLLLFLAVFGAYLLNFYNNNTLPLILIAIISVIPIITVFDKIPPKIYSIAILVIPFVLLSYNTLVGNYIHVSDSVFEFYFAKLVIKNCFWDKTISAPKNAMLSIVMLPPMFSEMLNISLTWVYKIIAPPLSLLIPLGLYQAYQRKWNRKISFFASFLFFSMFTFFTWEAVTMKMLFAGIFLTLLVLLLVDEEMESKRKALLFIVFSFSLITSHYGTSYIFMISLFIGLIILFLSRTIKSTSLITPNSVIFYSVLALSWYMFISSSCTFDTAVKLSYNILVRIRELYLPEPTANLLFGEWAITPQVLRALYLAITFFMAFGLLTELRTSKHIDEFSSLAFPFLGFLFLNYALAVGYYGGRIWYIISTLLAPYCIEGILNFSNFLVDLKKWRVNPLRQHINNHINTEKRASFMIVSIFLLIFLLFNSGFASEVIFKDYGPDIYLSKERITSSENVSMIEKERFYRKYITDYDVFGAKWLSKYKDAIKIYSDRRGGDVLYPYGNVSPLKPIIPLTNYTNLVRPCYVYLRYVNVVEGIMGMHGDLDFPLFYTYEIYPLINTCNKIYTNGGCEIYYGCARKFNDQTKRA